MRQVSRENTWRKRSIRHRAGAARTQFRGGLPSSSRRSRPRRPAGLRAPGSEVPPVPAPAAPHRRPRYLLAAEPRPAAPAGAPSIPARRSPRAAAGLPRRRAQPEGRGGGGSSFPSSARPPRATWAAPRPGPGRPPPSVLRPPPCVAGRGGRGLGSPPPPRGSSPGRGREPGAERSSPRLLREGAGIRQEFLPAATSALVPGGARARAGPPRGAAAADTRNRVLPTALRPPFVLEIGFPPRPALCSPGRPTPRSSASARADKDGKAIVLTKGTERKRCAPAFRDASSGPLEGRHPGVTPGRENRLHPYAAQPASGGRSIRHSSEMEASGIMSVLPRSEAELTSGCLRGLPSPAGR